MTEDSSSDERTSKKQRKRPISERLEAPSVFHRLGRVSSSSGAHSEGEHTHSVHVTAHSVQVTDYVPTHSTLKKAGESG